VLASRGAIEKRKSSWTEKQTVGKSKEKIHGEILGQEKDVSAPEKKEQQFSCDTRGTGKKKGDTSRKFGREKAVSEETSIEGPPVG